MHNTHHCGSHRRFSHTEDGAGSHAERHHRHESHGHYRGGGRSRRPFDYGELRLVMLGMIAEQPRHGYDLIKAIEERMGGSYSPSPGVIYPTLAYLEEAGQVTVAASEGGRKQYTITPDGQAALDANKAAVDAVFARLTPTEGGRAGVPAPLLRAMENLKLALRLRLSRGGLSAIHIETIAAALDDAARLVERS